MPEEAASGLWRSEDMVLLQLHMPRDAVHDAVEKIGQLGILQFLDLNSEVNLFQRDFSSSVRRCDNLERQVNFLWQEIEKEKIPIVKHFPSESLEPPILSEALVHGMEEEDNAAGISPIIAPATLSSSDLFDGGVFSYTGHAGFSLQDLENGMETLVSEVQDLIQQYEVLQGEWTRSCEYISVLTRHFGLSSSQEMGLTQLTGVILQDRVQVVTRLISLLTRGNCIIQTDPIEDMQFMNHATGAIEAKAVFLVYFYAPSFRERIQKILEVNGGALYPYPETFEQLTRMREALRHRVLEFEETIKQTSNRRRHILCMVAARCHAWRAAIITEKAIYGIMNLIQFQGATAMARAWCPRLSLPSVNQALRMVEEGHLSPSSCIIEEIHEHNLPIPTYFRMNKFVEGFQGIVDSYGTPRYKEINPGVFTVITFPYLFGIMYGDIGHGIIMTLFAIFLIIFEKKWEGKKLNEIFQMIFGGRYMILLMGLFSVYMGVLYNEFFGFPIELFASGYTWPPLPPLGPTGLVTPLIPNGNPSMKPPRPVIFGIDSSWAETENKLEMYNSIKMKCSVIVGVAQMLLGIFLSLFNHLHDKDWVLVYFRFIPEMFFLSSTFGYMSLLIIIKWCTTWNDPSLAPSLLETMTNFFLQPGSVHLPLFSGQAFIQVILLLIATVSAFVLLLGTPIMRYTEHKKRLRQPGVVYDIDAPPTMRDDKLPIREHPPSWDFARPASRENDHLYESENVVFFVQEDHHLEEEFDISEVIIHQVIHTIEYVLGAVSNTASYLRLWALSLAHSQLSEVFWNFAFIALLDLDGGFGILTFFGFAIWMTITLGLLLGMESLSAFLHALRLHWVEFQGKFYYGDGIPFIPFNISTILASLSD